VSFYDEKVQMTIPANFALFKKEIGKKYSMEAQDVDELIFQYIDDTREKLNINSEIDFQQAIFFFNKELTQNRRHVPVIYLEVSEKSMLYKREFEKSKVEVPVKEDTEKRKREELQKVIMEKEKLLKEMLEKEKIERKEKLERERLRKEEEERLRLEKEQKERLLAEMKLNEEFMRKQNEKQRLEAEKRLLEKARLERASKNVQPVVDDKEKILRAAFSNNPFMKKSEDNSDFNLALSRIINENMENAKAEILNKTIQQTSKIFSDFKNKSVINNNSIHIGIKCSGCYASPIRGNRYKCTVCNNFDFCEECENNLGESHKHPLLKIRSPESAPMEIKCTLENNKPSVSIKKELSLEDLIKVKPKPIIANNLVYQERNKYKFLLKAVRSSYSLENVNDETILDALVKSKGRSRMHWVGLRFVNKKG